jgi:polyferredoxin
MRDRRTAWLSARVAAYGAVWLMLVAAVATLVVRRADIDVLILRQAGTMFVTEPGGRVVNFYTVQAFNRTAIDQPFEIVVTSPAGATVTPLGPLDAVGRHGLLESRLMVSAPRTALAGAATPVHFEIRRRAVATRSIDSSFVGPAGSPSGTER